MRTEERSDSPDDVSNFKRLFAESGGTAVTAVTLLRLRSCLSRLNIFASLATILDRKQATETSNSKHIVFI